MVTIRKLRDGEQAFLAEMLYEALFVPEGHDKFPQEIIQDPTLAKYIVNWGTDALDIALVAEEDGELIGAIWGRRFTRDNAGFGFVDEETPELSVAVKEAWRGKGIGTKLVQEIGKAYREVGVKALSLSVDKKNQAYELYKKMGFEIVNMVADTETSVVMKKDLD
ncbi:GNAT family N-acetyltransferase [Tunicatimonas pelagia]|uniref:GNAT family N-acetyltransferase n=1 Tax=Tunicatimonas pelagia TaxID=931531 RepID=UPI002666C05D|nr:GNAT family N-acetyltransferase [Tunicatimonas pelagia]WKN43046.1 GNAT family N-acetyltransferase [Tunicatimonas pelagia]